MLSSQRCHALTSQRLVVLVSKYWMNPVLAPLYLVTAVPKCCIDETPCAAMARLLYLDGNTHQLKQPHSIPIKLHRVVGICPGVHPCLSMQAAFLDLRLADTLGQLLGRLVPVLGQGADAGSLCTMVLEAILTLQDPESCLNPMAPAAQRVPDETPTPAEVAFSHLQHAFSTLAVKLC